MNSASLTYCLSQRGLPSFETIKRNFSNPYFSFSSMYCSKSNWTREENGINEIVLFFCLVIRINFFLKSISSCKRFLISPRRSHSPYAREKMVMALVFSKCDENVSQVRKFRKRIWTSSSNMNFIRGISFHGYFSHTKGFFSRISFSTSQLKKAFKLLTLCFIVSSRFHCKLSLHMYSWESGFLTEAIFVMPITEMKSFAFLLCPAIVYLLLFLKVRWYSIYLLR